MTLNERKGLYGCLFLVSASLISYEVLLTRLISAMFVKYFSLMAISMAMMGLGLAGVLVQVRLGGLGEETKERVLLLGAAGLPLSLFLLPLFVAIARVPSYFLQFSDIFNLFFFISVCVLPFFCGGLVLALAYHQRADSVSGLYFFDLLGAAAGCLLAFGALNLTDGLSAILFSAFWGALAVPVICRRKPQPRRAALAGILFLLLALGINHGAHIISLPHPGGPDKKNAWERWSEFGLTTVTEKSTFSGVGISQSKHPHPLKNSLFKAIRHDYNSLTVAVDKNMDAEGQAVFKDQINNFALRFAQNPKVLVLGSGGGKEVLSALLCGSRDVTAVEFNRVIARDVMLDYLKDFSGDIYRRPGVRLVVDEARNFLNRSRERFDIILPVTGTTPRLMAAGCYVFSSEYLHTLEAYRAYLEHLTPRGVFAFKAALDSTDLNSIKPFYRLLATVKEMLEKSGRPALDHLLVVGGEVHPGLGSDYSLAVLFSPSPFGDEEIERAQKLAREMGFEVIFSARRQEEGLISRFLMADSLQPFYDSAPIDIRPVHDDRPYYYHHLKMKEGKPAGDMPDYYRLLIAISAIFLVYVLLLCLLPPLLAPARKLDRDWRANLPALVYFACLGAGFIGLELTLMQKANFVLGIPSYSFLVTVLSFTLFMGLGALAAGATGLEGVKIRFWLLLSTLTALLFIYKALYPSLLKTVAAWSAPAKMALLGTLFAPLGFLLGMPFVWGVRWLREKRNSRATAWMWAVNSTTSTMGAVGVTVLWLQWGHGATVLACLALYLLAALMFSLLPAKSR